MTVQHTPPALACPVAVETLRAKATHAFDQLIDLCTTSDDPFFTFEKRLLLAMMVLGRVLLELFLLARHQRLSQQPPPPDAAYRLGEPYAQRLLKTIYGEISYGRTCWIPRRGGAGWYPLDALLGLTSDRLTPWMMQWVAHLATRMSFVSVQCVCKMALQWAPATETIERITLGLGHRAAAFVGQLEPPKDDGAVLVIEMDGKCPPTATAAELAQRRGPRRVQHAAGCKCQRHRGRAKRQSRGSRKRRKRGDKSKNGKEVTVVVMYTLRREADGKLHGPLNKKVWATFAGRKAGASWARTQATRRGFGPETTKTVQVLTDGASGLKDNLKKWFPQAIFTLDVCHVVEKLWSLGRHFHKEGSAELQDWVSGWKEMLYGGRAAELVTKLKKMLHQASRQGPGTKARRQALASLIGYLSPRLSMMEYRKWRQQDLVIATGQVEGAVRHIVGERLDCSGMRWVQGKAEAILHLRCIEVNGDWEKFAVWWERQNRLQLEQRQPTRVATDRPIPLTKAG
jgi:hypothetical protein